jgi:hypothetical protein
LVQGDPTSRHQHRPCRLSHPNSIVQQLRSHLGYTANSLTAQCLTWAHHYLIKGNTRRSVYPSLCWLSADLCVQLNPQRPGDCPTCNRIWFLHWDNPQLVVNHIPCLWVNHYLHLHSLMITILGHFLKTKHDVLVKFSYIAGKIGSGNRHSSSQIRYYGSFWHFRRYFSTEQIAYMSGYFNLCSSEGCADDSGQPCSYNEFGTFLASCKLTQSLPGINLFECCMS